MRGNILGVLGEALVVFSSVTLIVGVMISVVYTKSPLDKR